MNATLTPAYEIERSSAEEAEKLISGSMSLSGILSPEETTILAGLKTLKRKRDWLAGRLAAKRLMARVLKEQGRRLALSKIEIKNRLDGSPYVSLPRAPRADSARYPISVTHSPAGGAAALGAPGQLIGIDLEAVEERPPAFLALMAHESELSGQLRANPLEQTRLWTLKEAVSKLLGVGLSVDLWDIRFLPTQEGPRLELHGKARSRWEGLGRPSISFESRVAPAEILSVAYTGGSHA